MNAAFQPSIYAVPELTFYFFAFTKRDGEPQIQAELRASVGSYQFAEMRKQHCFPNRPKNESCFKPRNTSQSLYISKEWRLSLPLRTGSVALNLHQRALAQLQHLLFALIVGRSLLSILF